MVACQQNKHPSVLRFERGRGGEGGLTVVIVVGFKTHMGYGLGKSGYGYGLYFVNPPCTHTHSTGRWVCGGFFGGFP